MHEQSHDRGTGQPAEARPTFAAPRLDLPRFQFSSGSSLARPATPAPAPAPRYTHAAPVQHAPVPMPHAPVHQPAAPPATPYANPTGFHQPAVVTYAAAAAAAPAPAPGPARPGPTAAPLRQLAASPTAPATTISWDRLEPARAEPTLLQRITPMHMGVLLVMVMVAMVVTSGPASVAVGTARLPALATGGGTGDPMLQPRAGTTAVTAAHANGAATRAAPATRRAATPAARQAAAARRARLARANRAWIRVGSARVRRAVRSGGIPSPAAAANLAVAGGGRVAAGSTGDVRLNGIPSPAAAEQLGPKTLAYRPDDGVTLPRMVGERDSHAIDSHYGADVLPMEQAVAAPAMTPGAAAAQAEQRVAVNELSGGTSGAPAVNGGLIVAY